MVQNCSIWHQWSRGDRSSFTDRDNAAPGERRDAEVRQGTPCSALRANEGGANDEGTVGRGDLVGCYLFFSFASPKLSAAELMQ